MISFGGVGLADNRAVVITQFFFLLFFAAERCFLVFARVQFDIVGWNTVSAADPDVPAGRTKKCVRMNWEKCRPRSRKET